MKKIISSLLILTLGIMSIACGGSKSSGGADQREIRISGSTSVAPIITKLSASFEAKNPQYRVIIESVGSSVGVADTINNNNDIGMASRNIKAEELGSVEPIVLCNDGIVVVVNPSASIDEINKQQLVALYMNNTPISSISKSVSREDGSGTRGAFSELTSIGEKEALPATVEILDSTGKVKTAVVNDEAKLGYISLGSLDNTVKALRYSDGGAYIAPSVENVQNGSYPLYRPFNLVVRKGATLGNGTQAFLEFCRSAEATALITENGYIPVN